MLEKQSAIYDAPHDPKFANEGRTYADGQPCNRDCPEPYPCAVRRHQRKTHKEVVEYLRSDLYEPIGRGRNSLVWMSPLGWMVYDAQSEIGSYLSIHDPRDGKILAESDNADYNFLRSCLP